MVRLRHRFAALAGIVVLLSTTAGAGVASAQTTTTNPYAPGTTVAPLCTAASQNAGTVAIGQTVTFHLCGPFTPGATTPLQVNGAAAGNKTADATGTVTVVITINSATSASVNDPVTVPVTCGSNTATASVGGVSQSGTFNLVCTTASTSGLAFTGANVLKGVLGALLLIVIGGALVLGQRRRRSSQTL